MAILKNLKDNKGTITGTVTIPAFTFSPNDGLAEMIVEAWGNEDFRKQLLARAADHITVTPAAVQLATSSVNAAGFDLKRAVVISEHEHDHNYTMQADDEVVFVLPDQTRLGNPFARTSCLLDTARLLMACTPNGI